MLSIPSLWSRLCRFFSKTDDDAEDGFVRTDDDFYYQDLAVARRSLSYRTNEESGHERRRRVGLYALLTGLVVGILSPLLPASSTVGIVAVVLSAAGFFVMIARLTHGTD